MSRAVASSFHWLSVLRTEAVVLGLVNREIDRINPCTGRRYLTSTTLVKSNFGWTMWWAIPTTKRPAMATLIA